MPSTSQPTPPTSDDESIPGGTPEHSPMQRYNTTKRGDSPSSRSMASGGSRVSRAPQPQLQQQQQQTYYSFDVRMEHQDCTGCVNALPRDRQAVERAHLLESSPDAAQSHYSGATAGPGVTQFNNLLVEVHGEGDHGSGYHDEMTSMWPFVPSRTERARHLGACKTGPGKQVNGPALLVRGRGSASRAPVLPTITIPRQTHIDPVMSLGMGVGEGEGVPLPVEEAAQVNGGYILFRDE